MLLPEILVPAGWLDRACRVALSERPSWVFLRAGMPVLHALTTPAGREEAAACLFACSVVVGRRRHDRVHGPLLGFVVASDLGVARLWEAVDFEGAPTTAEGHLTPWAATGIQAACSVLRASGPQVARIQLPEGW